MRPAYQKANVQCAIHYTLCYCVFSLEVGTYWVDYFSAALASLTVILTTTNTGPHSVLTRGALGEVVNLTKPMIESGLGVG